MLAFIGKYWLEFLLGIIATGATAFAKYFYNLYKKERDTEREKEYQQQKKEIINEVQQIMAKKHEQFAAVDTQITERLEQISKMIETLSDGILSIQGKQFKQECKSLLKSEHTITVDEWMYLNKEHDIYKDLNGNHEGDLLFNDVSIKYHNQLDK